MKLLWSVWNHIDIHLRCLHASGPHFTKEKAVLGQIGSKLKPAGLCSYTSILVIYVHIDCIQFYLLYI